MTPESALDLARLRRLYPSLILHGGTAEQRRELALDLSRAVLCSAEPASRPCGQCSHCRRIAVDADAGVFHPDFRVLHRDLKTSTSVDATRRFLEICQQTPFEAVGQAFVIAEAESLSNEAANALLKVLEEPPTGAPRNFFLLAPSRQDLLPTLRSRSWEIYLGGGVGIDREMERDLLERLRPVIAESSPGLVPMRLAAELEGGADFKDPRAEAPWALAASVVARLAGDRPDPQERRRWLELAEDLLDAPRWRLRGIPPQRLLEGLATRHLRGDRFATSLAHR